MTTSNANQQEKNIITDRPILDTKEDAFFSESRLVDPMLEVISGNKITPCTIALMGEWGSGKTSALNLLKNKLKSDKNKKNIVIDFDPLIEGKVEIHDILVCFYLKLLSTLDNEKREIAKKALRSFLHLASCKMSVGLPGIASMEFNISKNIDEALKVWEEEKPQLYSKQILDLNISLKENPLYVIIDEIDRLPSKQILNFLMFSRVLESFDNLVCIIAFDYTQVIEKFISENTLGNTNYSAVTTYIDKLFQIRFDVCNILSIDAITEYAKKKIKIIFKENDELINLTNEADASQVFHDILVYLGTPRRIKKWLMSLLKNKIFIENAINENKLLWLKFIAAYVKHPIILDVFLREEVSTYLCTDSKAEYERQMKLLKTKISYKKDLPNNLTKKFDKDNMEHKKTQEYLSDFLFPEHKYNAQKALIYAFADGIQTEDELNGVNNFFEQNSNDVLRSLVKNDRKTAVLALDIANALEKTNLKLKKPPEISILNKLWFQKKCISVGDSPSEEFTSLITNLFSHVPRDTLIDKGILSLSAHYVKKLLEHFGISNKNGAYNLGGFRKNETQKQFFYKDEKIQSQDELEKILTKWRDNFENSLLGDKGQLFINSKNKINLLFRYIQWSNTLDEQEPQKRLTDIIKNYLKSDVISEENKKQFIEDFKKENSDSRNKSPSNIEYLFNNDPDICSYLDVDGTSLAQDVVE